MFHCTWLIIVLGDIFPVEGGDVLDGDAEDFHFPEYLLQVAGDEPLALLVADDVPGSGADEIPDAALVVDDALGGELVVGAGDGVGIDLQGDTAFPDGRDALALRPCACQYPLAYRVGYLQVDGFMLVEFHGCLSFEGLVLYPADAEVGEDPEDYGQDVAGEYHHCLYEVLDPVGHDFDFHAVEDCFIEVLYGGYYRPGGAYGDQESDAADYQEGLAYLVGAEEHGHEDEGGLAEQHAEIGVEEQGGSGVEQPVEDERFLRRGVDVE